MRWEHIAEQAEQDLVRTTAIPQEASCVSISVDRVSLPMEEPASSDATKGSELHVEVAWRMAYCGVLTLHDADGRALSSIRYGRMPNGGRELMEEALEADLIELLRRSPDLRVMGLADGAVEMQQMLDRILAEHHPVAVSIDFWHLVEKLGRAVATTRRSTSVYVGMWKDLLLEDDHAIERIGMMLRTWARPQEGQTPDRRHYGNSKSSAERPPRPSYQR